jgi:hypothetical protein
VLGGCGEPQVTGAVDPGRAATGPLTALGECGPLPTAAEGVEVPDGVQLPEGAVVTDVLEQGPLTSVTAEVRRTPVEVRVEFEARDDLELIVVEDEVWESELLVSDGAHRTYVKTAALCATGSAVSAVVGAESAAGALPRPTGAAAGG